MILTGVILYNSDHNKYYLKIRITDVESGERVYQTRAIENKDVNTYKMFNNRISELAEKLTNKLIDPKVENQDKVIDKALETMPNFPGGENVLSQYLSRNLTYPPYAAKMRVQGRVICQFVVNEDGSISDINVIHSVSPDLDAEAIRIIKRMPRWTPGTHDGEAVSVRYTLPVNFKLQ